MIPYLSKKVLSLFPSSYSRGVRSYNVHAYRIISRKDFPRSPPTSFSFCSDVQSIHKGLIFIFKVKFANPWAPLFPSRRSREQLWVWELAHCSLCSQLPFGRAPQHSSQCSHVPSTVKSSQILRVSYFNDTVWVTDLFQRVRA